MARGRKPLEIGEVGDVTYTDLPDGQVEAVVRYRNSAGQRKRLKRRRGSRTAARKAVMAAVEDVISVESFGDVDGDTRLSEFLEVWLRQHTMSMNTNRVYRSAMELHIVPAIGELRLRELTTARVERFLQGLEGLGTRKTSRAVLSAAATLAVRWGLLAVNPVRETSPVRSSGESPRALDLEDVQALRDAMHAHAGSNKTGPPRAMWLPWLVDFILGTGLRIGEAMAVRWQDIDGLEGDSPVVRISGTLVWEKGVGTYRQDYPKSESSKRSLQLPPIAVEALRRQREDNGAGYTEWCFPTVYSTPVSTDAAERALRAALPEALEWVEYRSIRKTVGTMIANNMSTDAAMLQLGHSDSRVTMKHYLQRPDTAPGGVVLNMFRRHGDGQGVEDQPAG